MRIQSIAALLKGNTYPGRGIIVGKSPDGERAVAAYFIMGRSENSRNRVFVQDGSGIRTKAYDPSKMKDPSLIIYAPVRVLGTNTFITNGDQTDTIFENVGSGMSFEESLRGRVFEPDAPNFTPRISAMISAEDGNFSYAFSILKKNTDEPTGCDRYTYVYDTPVAGEGRFIHTYEGDGSPLPSFEGEPRRVDILDDIDEYAALIWESLNRENKVALFVRSTLLRDGTYESRIINACQDAYAES